MSRTPLSFFFRPVAALVLALILAVGGVAQAEPAVTVPRYTHPGTGQTFYFVLTDRFANGESANDTAGLPGGPDDHGFDPTRISHYHGGDFIGLTQHLDYLQGLGVTAVWVTPPFRNKPVQQGTAGYHGYWITDFLQIDPHLGTNAEYRAFIAEAHRRGMRVYMDIIVNHTADVIQLDGDFSYREIAAAPYRDANGLAFDARAVAYNGHNDATVFPDLSAEVSFAYRPTVPAAERDIKKPAWLNDITLYHNRGNTTFAGENSVHGDFVGLDDVFTEHPQAVRGFIEVFEHWLEEYGVDGYRIDTVRHVNTAFWQAFSPAIKDHARSIGRPDFVQFGEVYNDAGDASVLAQFSTNTIPIDTTLDFGFFVAARKFVSQGGSAADLTEFFNADDYYTDHDSNVHTTTTFLGNHDAGRFAYFVQQDNPGASRELQADLVKLGHGLLYFSRGQPVIYYGDEQGMIGRGGHDMQARETLFASQAPDFRDAELLGTDRTGADDKFDREHPFYRLFAELGDLRKKHAALRTGALLPRPVSDAGLMAFSRIEREERVEYLAVFNNSRETTLRGKVTTLQPTGARLSPVFHSGSNYPTALEVGAGGATTVELAPLQFALWRAESPLPVPAGKMSVALVKPAGAAEIHFGSREVDGLIFPDRPELRAELSGNDGYAEVTFLLRRASRPDQYELLGTDDTEPYRIFWSRPADLASDDEFTILVTATDLRGRVASDQLGGITVSAARDIPFGVPGTTVPTITRQPDGSAGKTLQVEATGTAPLEYQWLCNGELIEGADAATLKVSQPGHYTALVRNVAGTVLSEAVEMR